MQFKVCKKQKKKLKLKYITNQQMGQWEPLCCTVGVEWVTEMVSMI